MNNEGKNNEYKFICFAQVICFICDALQLCNKAFFSLRAGSTINAVMLKCI